MKPSSGVTVQQLPVQWMLHNGYPVPPDMLQYYDQIGNLSAGSSDTLEPAFTGGSWQDNQEQQLLFFQCHDLSNRITPGVMRQYRYYVGRNSKQRLREAKLQAADYMIFC